MLIAVIALVGVLVALDLVLTFGVIKRMREHTELLSDLTGGRPSIKVGEEVGEFVATTVDGEPISRETLVDDTVVAFFSPTCQPCQEKLPKFVDFAHQLDKERVLAVVVGDADQADTQITTLKTVARVVFEDNNNGAVCEAFQVMAFPSVLRVGANGQPVVTDDRVVVDAPVPAAV